MEPADSIVRLGFKRWYERQLIESHAWLISGLLCLFAILACAEELTFRGSAARLLAYVVVVFLAGVAGTYALAAYLRGLGLAMHLSEQATCPSCGTYARFRMVSATRARCRKCDNEWPLID